MPTDVLPRTDALAIYLNDHLAGATGALELAKRATAAATPENRPVFERLTAETEDDRRALLAIMATLDIPVRHYKILAAWIGEKAGRAKLNGHLVKRAPLSSLEETELLALTVHAKTSCWKALRELAEHDPRLDIHHLDDLIHRAGRQADQLEGLRATVARAVLLDETARPDPAQSNGG
jgi:hypothetical protein